MQKSTRAWAKRKLEFAISGIDQVATHLLEVATVYEKLHPEISDPIYMSMNIMSEAQALLSHLKGQF